MGEADRSDPAAQRGRLEPGLGPRSEKQSDRLGGGGQSEFSEGLNEFGVQRELPVGCT